METTTTQPEHMMMPEPQAEHQWLQKLVGDWTVEGEAPMEPGQPPMTFRGPSASAPSEASGCWPRGRVRCPAVVPRRR